MSGKDQAMPPLARGLPGMGIGAVDLVEQYRSLEPRIEDVLREVARSGQYILGEGVERFEQKLAHHSEAKFAVGVASGTDALVLALLAVGVKPGDEVVTTPFSFFATAAAIVRVGATPVFADINRATFNISVDEVERAITSRTAAIVPVHLFGLSADLVGLRSIFRGPIVADGAQAIGAMLDSVPIASLATATTLSFFPTKNLGGLGDGGAVLTDSPEIAAEVDLLRRQGAIRKYQHEKVGFNSRLDALQAAILEVKLDELDRWNERRRSIAAAYSAALSGHSSIEVPTFHPSSSHVYNQYTIRVSHGARDSLLEHLRSRGIQTQVNYPTPLHLQPALRDLGYESASLPVSEMVCGEVLSLPCYPELTPAQQDRVVQAVLDFDP